MAFIARLRWRYTFFAFPSRDLISNSMALLNPCFSRYYGYGFMAFYFSVCLDMRHGQNEGDVFDVAYILLHSSSEVSADVLSTDITAVLRNNSRVFASVNLYLSSQQLSNHI